MNERVYEERIEIRIKGLVGYRGMRCLFNLFDFNYMY